MFFFFTVCAKWKCTFLEMYINLSVADGRVLQYGQMSMSSEAEGDPLVTKAYQEAGGDQGLLNLLTDNTVFYVGGYPKSFKVSSWGGLEASVVG